MKRFLKYFLICLLAAVLTFTLGFATNKITNEAIPYWLVPIFQPPWIWPTILIIILLSAVVASFTLLIPQSTDTIESESGSNTNALRNRKIMLKRVNNFWIKGVLEKSLYNEVLIELQLKEEHESVEYPWDMIIQSPNQPKEKLEPGTQIIEVFDQHHNLLILGEPGSGKTTMLLDLARSKIQGAKKDPMEPIPVVFNLSSWASKKQTISEWLVDELKTKYNIPKKVAEPWVENDELLLLLDGLDEVAKDQQKDCVEALNKFSQDSMSQIVVCSRSGDYKELEQKLKLQNAIELKELSGKQVKHYLEKTGQDVSAIREILKRDKLLRELTKSPLMLNITVLAFQGLSTGNLSSIGTVESRREYLFETYVQRMFERRGTNKRYAQEQIIDWLARLAQRMTENNQAEFLIERMQTSWLRNNLQMRLYGFILGWNVGLYFGILWGMFAGVGNGLFNGFISGLLVGIISGLLFGFMAGFLMGCLFCGLAVRWVCGIEIRPVQRVRWSWNRTKHELGVKLRDKWNRRMTLAVGAMLVVGVIGGVAIDSGTVLLIFTVLILPLLSTLIFGGIHTVEVETGMNPNQGTWQSIRYAVLMMGLVGFGFLLIALIFYLGALGGALFFPVLIAALVSGMYFGGFAFIQHFALRFILWRTNQLPFLLVPFLDYCVDRIFLRRVGGGYIFIHRYLMEYFASLESEQ